MTCAECGNATRERKIVYGDGSEIVAWQAPDGKVRCGVLDQDVPLDFGCVKFAEGGQTDIQTKSGAPWQHWCMVPCPDCAGNAGASGGVCNRCVGTANVRLYDDGYVGDERTRKHPNEVRVAVEVDPGTILKPLPSPDVLSASP